MYIVHNNCARVEYYNMGHVDFPVLLVESAAGIQNILYSAVSQSSQADDLEAW